MESWLERIYDVLMKIFSVLSKDKTKDFGGVKATRNYKVLEKASSELGVKEVVGEKSNAKIVKYHQYASTSNDASQGMADSVPWCSSFVCYCVEMVGMGSTNSRLARSWLKWGLSTKKNPLPGDVVVYWRGSKSGWQGHVGFYLGETESFIYTLGGNQSDAVNVTRYSKSKLLDIRRSSKARSLTEPEQDDLWDAADKIIAGKPINTDAKMS